MQVFREVVMVRRFSRLLLVAVAMMAGGSEARAAKHFIQTYIDAQGGCGSSAGSLSFVLAGGGLQAPFGKPAGDWTDDDLSALPRILAECEKTAAGINSFRAAEIRGEARDLEARVPRIVQAARAEHARQAAQLQARREIAQSRINAARQRAEAEQAIAEEEVQKLEAEASRAEAEAKIAAGRREQAQRNTRERQAEAFTPSIEPKPRVDAQATMVPLATFGFDAPTFRRMYDGHLRNDGDSGITDCGDSAGLCICKFDDASFKKSVDAFKKLDLANGQFRSKLRLVIASQNGRVSKIVVSGDRADPMNLFGYIGKVGSLLKTLEPEMSDQAQQSLLTSDLGLMRGDDDPTIGSEKLVIRNGYVARCRQSALSESTATICAFEPRS